MPYKDPEQKKEWERLHRPERLARRRELRQREVGSMPAPEATLPTHDGVSALLPIVGGLAGLGLAAYQPKLAVGTGGLTLVIAAILKKGSMWWILGTIVLVLGIFFLWIDRDEEVTPKSA
jgi:hypothetical protein